MPINLFYFIVALAIISAVTASTVTYSIVGLPSSNDVEFGVVVDDSTYTLSPSQESAILFQLDAPTAKKSYHFVELKKGTGEIVHEEGFERDVIQSQVNHVYGRNWVTKSIKTFERVYDEVGFRHKTSLHPADEIPSLHIQADQDEIDRIHEHYNQKISVKADLTFIGSNDIQKFSNVQFNIAGRGSRFEPKPSYNIHLAKGELLGGYKTLKLRAAATDPTFLRDKMSFDMLVAAGLPASRISYKRVYLNNVALGLYVFAEKYDKDWVDQNASPGLPSEYKNGVFYQGTGSTKFKGEISDLRYISDDPNVYAEHGYTIAVEDKTEKKGFTVLADFIKFIDLQLKNPISNSTENEKEIVAEWAKYLGVEVFLRNMVLEFLVTGWDNYLAYGDNYYLYKCPIMHFFVYVGWDMELTFGNSPFPKSIQLEGDYRHVEGIQNRPLTKALFRVPIFRSYFESALQKIVTSIFEPSKSFPVIDSLVEFLRDDVKWDQDLQKVNAGKNFDNPPESDPNGGKIIDNSPTNIPKNTDKELSKEHIRISREIIDFQKSINGPTGFDSLMGIKEFIQGKYDNVKAHI